MAILLNDHPDNNQFNVLLIGNNPIELSAIYDRLIKLKNKNFMAEIAFDVKSALKNRLNFKPSFIIIDDNIGRAQLKKIIAAFNENKDTEDIPITLLKNRNFGYSPEGVQEYVLKDNVDGESLAKALINSKRLKKTQRLLYKTYYRSKRRLGLAFL